MCIQKNESICHSVERCYQPAANGMRSLWLVAGVCGSHYDDNCLHTLWYTSIETCLSSPRCNVPREVYIRISTMSGSTFIFATYVVLMSKLCRLQIWRLIRVGVWHPLATLSRYIIVIRFLVQTRTVLGVTHVFAKRPQPYTIKYSRNVSGGRIGVDAWGQSGGSLSHTGTSAQWKEYRMRKKRRKE